MSDTTNIAYTSSLTDICKINSSFDTGILRICYAGENRNKTYISKEALENAIPSIYNCPVVCNYNRDDNSIGGHDMEIVTDSQGNLKVVNLTTPIGVIPESAKVWFENYEENGTVHEYLYTEVLLWKRQEAYKKIKDDGITKQSMELKILGGKSVDGIYHINNFEFKAFTLVGEEPCFESSALQVFSHTDFKKQLAEMINDLKQTFTKDNTTIDNKHLTLTKGGAVTLENKAKEGSNVKSEIFTLTDNIRGELIRVLSKEKVERDWGIDCRYHYIDFDIDSKQVYVFDSNEDWLLYGFTFSVDGDVVTIDYDSKKRKKYEIVDFEEGDKESSAIAGVIKPIEDKFKNSSEQQNKLSQDLNAALEENESMKKELNELREFKADTEKAIVENEKNEMFSRFEDLEGIEEFELLKSDNSDYDIECLEEKCYAIRGRHGSELKFTKTKTPKIKVPKVDRPDEPYGGLFIKYAKENK